MTTADIPMKVPGATEAEQRSLSAVRNAKGNVNRAAKKLGIQKGTVYAHLRSLRQKAEQVSATSNGQPAPSRVRDAEDPLTQAIDDVRRAGNVRRNRLGEIDTLKQQAVNAIEEAEAEIKDLDAELQEVSAELGRIDEIEKSLEAV